MGQGPNAGQGDGKLRVVGVSQTDAGRLDQQAEVMGIDQRHRGRLRLKAGQQSLYLVGREDSFIQDTAAAPDAYFVANAQGSDTLDGNGFVEMTF
jgi:hypothetical protein